MCLPHGGVLELHQLAFTKHFAYVFPITFLYQPIDESKRTSAIDSTMITPSSLSPLIPLSQAIL